MMRHLKRNLHRELDDTRNLAVFAPRRLIDELFHTVFFNGVDVGFAGFKNMLDDAHRALLMTVADILTEESHASPLGKTGSGFFVHEENGEIAIDDCDARAEFILPGSDSIFGLCI